MRAVELRSPLEEQCSGEHREASDHGWARKGVNEGRGGAGRGGGGGAGGGAGSMCNEKGGEEPTRGAIGVLGSSISPTLGLMKGKAYLHIGSLAIDRCANVNTHGIDRNLECLVPEQIVAVYGALPLNRRHDR